MEYQMRSLMHKSYPGPRTCAAFLTLFAIAAAVTGCAKQTPPPIATESPAQMQQSIQNHAQSYEAFMRSHPNAYHNGGQ
jgi:hypothetical protein